MGTPICSYGNNHLDPGKRPQSYTAEMVNLSFFKYAKMELKSDRVPPNVRFEVDDVEADWTYHQKFDYIHCRFMGIAIKDWPRLIRQCHE